MDTTSVSKIPEHSLIVDSYSIEPEIESMAIVLDADELAFEVGAWLMGIRAFGTTSHALFAHESVQGSASLQREFRIVHLAIRNALKLCLRLRRTPGGESVLATGGLDLAGLDRLTSSLRSAAASSLALGGAATVTFEAWSGWVRSFTEAAELENFERRMATFSKRSAYAALPRGMRELFESDGISVPDRFDYFDVVPRVAVSLRYLEIVGKMMRNDEPLKPALLILSAVYTEAREMVEHMNLRLERYEDSHSHLFNSLDSASYSASLELKKVFKQELRGMIAVLPPTSVFARVETAYSLLLDSFQQILLDLARTVDPTVTLFDFFPRFQIKLDQSMILREHLWQILKAVRAAEEAPEKARVGLLKQELADFVTITIRFLHYKDEETFERFSEEVHAAVDKKDLVPVLHRFGAYLETLFGQVCMRGVLSDYPFQHSN